MASLKSIFTGIFTTSLCYCDDDEMRFGRRQGVAIKVGAWMR